MIQLLLVLDAEIGEKRLTGERQFVDGALKGLLLLGKDLILVLELLTLLDVCLLFS